MGKEISCLQADISGLQGLSVHTDSQGTATARRNVHDCQKRHSKSVRLLYELRISLIRSEQVFNSSAKSYTINGFFPL